MNKIELLAPAGSLERIRVALSYGADAVYFGGINYSLRANAKNLNIKEIKEACEYAHSLGKKVYVTVNIIFHNEDTIGLVEYLKELWLKQQGKCAISNIDMTYIFNCGRVPTNVSIDRIDSTKGYTINNIQLVCMACNQMKSDLSEYKLYEFCKAIVNNYESKNNKNSK